MKNKGERWKLNPLPFRTQDERIGWDSGEGPASMRRFLIGVESDSAAGLESARCFFVGVSTTISEKNSQLTEMLILERDAKKKRTNGQK